MTVSAVNCCSKNLSIAENTKFTNVPFVVFNLSYLAAQMWCLGRFLPSMIGSLVPEDDEQWQLFQIILEITDLVLSPLATERSMGVLEGLIEEHHHTFIQLYSGRSVIPKMHYLAHYPSHMYN